VDVNCLSCGKTLEPVDISDAAEYQLDNALWVKFGGGYAMFIDPIDKDNVPEAVICHECAHDLCAKVPWIGKLLDPEHSHTHTHGRNWTGHTGWDLPHDNTG
jgi:hypothetical protein